jgi:peptidoglycan/LPS O-acetylase OafA/YrhL
LVPLAIIVTVGIAFGHPEKAVTWSLYCELVYYAIYPLLLKINLSWKTKFIISWVIAASIISIASYHDVFAFVKQTNNNYQGYYWQFGNYVTWIIGLPCWLLGVLIAENIDQLKTATFSKVVVYRLAVFAISCFCCFGKFHLHISYLITMNVFALVLYKWLQTEIVYFKNKQPNLMLEKMGKFSYSIYLCHPIALVLLKHYIELNNYTYLLFVALTVLLGYVFYLLIERPSHQLARHINQRLFLPVK